jgi:hypothetical protein
MIWLYYLGQKMLILGLCYHFANLNQEKMKCKKESAIVRKKLEGLFLSEVVGVIGTNVK